MNIICKHHGVSDMISNIRAFSCVKCERNEGPMTYDEFIINAKKVHGDKYDYSKVNFVDAITSVDIICKEHGVRQQKPHDHLSGKGCRICSIFK